VIDNPSFSFIYTRRRKKKYTESIASEKLHTAQHLLLPRFYWTFQSKCTFTHAEFITPPQLLLYKTILQFILHIIGGINPAPNSLQTLHCAHQTCCWHRSYNLAFASQYYYCASCSTFQLLHPANHELLACFLIAVIFVFKD